MYYDPCSPSVSIALALIHPCSDLLTTSIIDCSRYTHCPSSPCITKAAPPSRAPPANSARRRFFPSRCCRPAYCTSLPCLVMLLPSAASIWPQPAPTLSLSSMAAAAAKSRCTSRAPTRPMKSLCLPSCPKLRLQCHAHPPSCSHSIISVASQPSTTLDTPTQSLQCW